MAARSFEHVHIHLQDYLLSPHRTPWTEHVTPKTCKHLWFIPLPEQSAIQNRSPLLLKSLYMAISVLMADGSTKHTDIMSNIMQNTCGVEMWRSQYNYIMNPIIHLFTWDIKLYFCTLETSYFMLWYLE